MSSSSIPLYRALALQWDTTSATRLTYSHPTHMDTYRSELILSCRALPTAFPFLSLSSAASKHTPKLTSSRGNQHAAHDETCLYMFWKVSPAMYIVLISHAHKTILDIQTKFRHQTEIFSTGVSQSINQSITQVIIAPSYEKPPMGCVDGQRWSFIRVVRESSTGDSCQLEYSAYVARGCWKAGLVYG
jgi:hypothetical protein